MLRRPLRVKRRIYETGGAKTEKHKNNFAPEDTPKTCKLLLTLGSENDNILHAAIDCNAEVSELADEQD